MISDNTPYLTVGHRGWPQLYPENTIVGLLAALHEGADALELDVQLTADGIPVLLHDANLKRTCGVNISIFDLFSKNLPEYSCHEPSRFGEKFNQTPVSTLAAFCETLARLKNTSGDQCRVFIEIKQESLDNFEPSFVYQSIRSASASIAQQRVFISFDFDVLRFAQRDGENVGWVLDAYDENHLTKAHSLLPEYLIVNYKKIVDDKPLRQGPWQWFLYDICDRDLAQDWCAKGARYIETWDIKSL